jgi:DNA-binding CsgD family transcriptional regulator
MTMITSPIEPPQYGAGRKPPVFRQHDAHLHELKRRLLGYLDEIVYPAQEGMKELRIPVKLWLPEVESYAWMEVIAEAARLGRIPYSTGWRRLRHDAAVNGIYPPVGDIIEVSRCGTPVLYRLRGKTRCRECGVPSAPIYQSACGVCFDCQLAELPGIGGRAPVVFEQQTRAARRAWREEDLDGCAPPHRSMADVLLLGITPMQLEVARMYIQGYTQAEIGKMTNRSEQCVNTMIKRIRIRLKRMGLRPLVRDENRSGKSRHVRNLSAVQMATIGMEDQCDDQE